MILLARQEPLQHERTHGTNETQQLFAVEEHLMPVPKGFAPRHSCFWFLPRYPDSWYRDITSNKKFFSLAATYRGSIVGMIVAEIKSRTKVHKEVCDCPAGQNPPLLWRMGMAPVWGADFPPQFRRLILS